MTNPEQLYLGVMSGTSLDGIDLALVRIGVPFTWEILAFRSIPFRADQKANLVSTLDHPRWHLDQVCAVHAVLGEWFGEAVAHFLREQALQADQIRAIGFHGLTVRHTPEPLDVLGCRGRGTLQLGDPFIVRHHCGIPVIFDFRAADMAAGGQGAPLAPFLDHLVFRQTDHGRILLNLGGIANLSFLPPTNGPVIAFDSGPANMVIDALMSRHPNQPQAFDPEGRFAAAGKVIDELLTECLQLPYFRQPPPKSTGREVFGDSYCEALLARAKTHPFADVLATATELTARTVAEAIINFAPNGAPSDYPELIVSGGGANNPFLMQRLQAHLPNCRLHTSDQFGLDPDAKEALLMAVLAWAHLERVPGNIPSVTGANRAVVLGASTG